MKTSTKPRFNQRTHKKQRGLVLFFALIALVAMSLAAVSLIRSVDSSTMIAGNLSFKQSATSAGDIGVEAALLTLVNAQAAAGALDPLVDAAHSSNTTDPSVGYYSSVDDNPASPNYVNLKDDNTWKISGIPEITDASGNGIRYIIQRMCRTPNLRAADADCLFSGVAEDTSGQDVKDLTNICNGPGCNAIGTPPQMRVTVRVTAPRNTVSYLQAFVY